MPGVGGFIKGNNFYGETAGVYRLRDIQFSPIVPIEYLIVAGGGGGAASREGDGG